MLKTSEEISKGKLYFKNILMLGSLVCSERQWGKTYHTLYIEKNLVVVCLQFSRNIVAKPI